MKPRNEILAIVGTHPDTRADAPYDNPAVDIWVFNEAFVGKWATRVDAIFQMHIPDIYKSPLNRNDPKHYQHLQETSATVWMQEVDPTIPTSKKYPLDEICNRFLAGDRYFLSSIDYALALALHLNYKHILIYGVEMASHTEYYYQREGLLVWLSIAKALGVRIDIYSNLKLYDRPCYGYDGVITQEPRELARDIRQLRLTVDEQREKVYKADRAMHRSFHSHSEMNAKINAAITEKHMLGEMEGELGEMERYHKKTKDMQQAGQVVYLDRNELEMAAGKALQKIEPYKDEIQRTAGKLDYVFNAWNITQHPTALEQIKMFAEAHIEAGYQAGYQAGIYKANHQLAGKIDDAIRAAGGKKAEAIITGEIWQEQSQ